MAAGASSAEGRLPGERWSIPKHHLFHGWKRQPNVPVLPRAMLQRCRSPLRCGSGLAVPEAHREPPAAERPPPLQAAGIKAAPTQQKVKITRSLNKTAKPLLPARDQSTFMKRLIFFSPFSSTSSERPQALCLTPVEPTVAHPAWFSSPLLHTARNTARDLTPVQLPKDSTALQRSMPGSWGPAGSAGGGQVTALPAQLTLSVSPKDSAKQSLQNQVKYQCMISSTGFSNFVFLRSDKKGRFFPECLFKGFPTAYTQSI